MGRSLASPRIQPLFKMLVQPLTHLRPDLAGIGELAPLADVVFFARSFKFVNEFFHEHQLLHVLVPEMLFALIGGLLLSVFGSYAHGGITPSRSQWAPGFDVNAAFPMEKRQWEIRRSSLYVSA